MSEPEDGGWSDGSADMDVDDIVDSTSVESELDDEEEEENEIMIHNPILPPIVRSSARLSTQMPLRAFTRAYTRANTHLVTQPLIRSPPRSPIRSPGQRAPEVNFYTVSGDSIDSTDSVNYQVADLNRYEMGYIQPFPLNLHRSGGYTETHSTAPSGSTQEELQQPIRVLENQSQSYVPRLNPSSPRRYVEPHMETAEYALPPISSEETVENTTNNSSNEDVSSCPICLDDFTNTGTHKPACLKCGHIFGESCLQRWIKVACNADARRCPTCNTKASAKDIRVLYAKKIVAVDTAELSSVQNKLRREQIEKDVLKTEIENWRSKNSTLREEVKRLKTLVDKMIAGVPPSSIGPTSGRQCLKRIKIHGTNPGCRVMAFNRNNMLLVVSQQGEPPFVNSHAIRKLNALILEPTKEYIYAHKKQIRDMSFHPIDHNQLATVSLDKCVCLTDLSSNSVVSSLEVDEPLWSCCWAGNNTNILVAGSQMGSLFYLDRRYMKLLHAHVNRKPACVSLSPIPSSTFRSFPTGGFLKTRMDLLSIFEQDMTHEVFNYKENQLLLKGKWSSSAYDIQSNLLLTSAKPCGANQSIRHIVSKISNLNEDGPTIQPVVTFYGGDMATQLTRSCFVPSTDNHEDVLVCGYDEKSKTIKIFNVNTNTNIHNFSVKEKFTDLCPLNGVSMNGRRTLAGLSECGVSIFSV